MTNRLKQFALFMGLFTTMTVNAQNGPRNNSVNFPEAVPTNSKVKFIDQEDEIINFHILRMLFMIIQTESI